MKILEPQKWIEKVYGEDGSNYLEQEHIDYYDLLSYMKSYGEYVERKTKQIIKAKTS